MTRSEKEAVVGSLSDMFSGASGIYLTDFTGMDVASATELRKQLKGSSVSYRVVKNTLARLALDRSGKEMLKEFFQGPTGVAATVEDLLGLSAYMEASALAELMREDLSLSGAFLRIDPAQESVLYRTLKETPGVAGVALTSVPAPGHLHPVQGC